MFDQLVEIETELLKRFAERCAAVEAEKIHGKLGSDEELRRQIADGPRLVLIVVVRGLDPAIQQPVPDRVGNGEIPVVGRSDFRKLALKVKKVIEEVAFDVLDVQS